MWLAERHPKGITYVTEVETSETGIVFHSFNFDEMEVNGNSEDEEYVWQPRKRRDAANVTLCWRSHLCS